MTDAFPRYYILVDRVPFAVDLMSWAAWFERNDRVVEKTAIGKVEVSTVFLGLNHNLRGGDPVLFETLVIGGPLGGEMDRYCSRAEAERGHAEMVAKVKIAAARVKNIADNAGVKT